MQPSIGYDHAKAHEYILHVIRELRHYGRPPDAAKLILPIEIEYVAATLTSTFFLANTAESGSRAWYSGNPEDLVDELSKCPRESILLEEAEKAATALLVREGIITRRAAYPDLARRLEFFDPEGMQKRKRRCDYGRLAEVLYVWASRLVYHGETRRFVLGRMAIHFGLWTSILALIPEYEVFKMIESARPPDTAII